MKNHSDGFIVKAGPRALEIIRDEGLRPERVRVVAGAAGGPKWLVLYHLDRLLLAGFYDRCATPVHFIGSSIGAWRFAALCQNDAVGALDRFRDAYIHQRYDHKPTPAEVTAESRRVMDGYIDDKKHRPDSHQPVAAAEYSCREMPPFDGL